MCHGDMDKSMSWDTLRPHKQHLPFDSQKPEYTQWVGMLSTYPDQLADMIAKLSKRQRLGLHKWGWKEACLPSNKCRKSLWSNMLSESVLQLQGGQMKAEQKGIAPK